MVDAELLKILVCPACKKPVKLVSSDGTAAGGESSLVCEACRKRYPVREDIPIMLIEESRPLESTGS